MPAGAPTIEQDEWVRDTLGLDVTGGSPPTQAPAAASPPAARPGGGQGGKTATLTPADPDSSISCAAREPAVWTQSVGSALTRQGPYKTGARIGGLPAGPAKSCTAPTGRTVKVATGPDGRVALTRDPPPITEITFSGGGGKGAALPGAVRALAESGVLKTVKELHGASVGSMTAALLAAGITPDAFQKLSDDTAFKPLIKGKERIMFHVPGDGLESLVRSAMTTSIGAQVEKFKEESEKSGATIDAATMKTLKTVIDRIKGGHGPTFNDLRILSKIIPDIKEVVITGTMMGKSAKPEPSHPPGPIKKCKPEPVVFDADTQPDMDVARAVHASAALPGVFDQVDIPLASGEVGRFEDGGVLNNAPTGDSIGEDRGLDPVPETGAMTFVFEDKDARELLDGDATPHRSWVEDDISSAEHGAADYGMNRALADRPEDVVMVPLKFIRPTGKVADFTGTQDGTLNFDIAKADRLKLQGMTKAATEAHLEKRQEKETRSFASVAQMLACTTREDLVALAAGKYPGAKAALAFRDTVCQQVKALETLADGGAGPGSRKVKAILQQIDGLATGDQERVGFIGRELNRSGALDGLLAAAKGAPGPKPDALAAGIAVAAVLAARQTARRILRQVVYPKMVRENPKDAGGILLAQMDTTLRDARSSADINRALRIGIKYFSHQTDPAGLLGHIDFVNDLTSQIQPED